MHTWNAEVNEHMIGINERLGFRPVERMGEFQKTSRLRYLQGRRLRYAGPGMRSSPDVRGWP